MELLLVDRVSPTADQPLGSDRFAFSSSRKFVPDTGHETMTNAFERVEAALKSAGKLSPAG
jgi:hypothetical protein